MRIREYGTSGPPVVLLHGGPAAQGYLAPVARGLADAFRVVEPFQRGSGDEPLTVARHVADLHELISRRGGPRPAVVGHSWGAMLALAHTAAHPDDAVALVLIGCGTFDAASRDRMIAIREERTDDPLRRRLESLSETIPDPDERLRAMGNLMLPLYSYRPAAGASELEACDARAHRETWDDMLRLQDDGVYPDAFASIHVPVIMLHGAYDPHPGGLIRASLTPHVPQLEYHEWEQCGHYPWLERAVREDFFAVLRRWLVARFAQGPCWIRAPASHRGGSPMGRVVPDGSPDRGRLAKPAGLPRRLGPSRPRLAHRRHRHVLRRRRSPHRLARVDPPRRPVLLLASAMLDRIMNLPLTTCTLRPWETADADSLVLHANNRKIWINLRDRFPHPYTIADAREFLRAAVEEEPKTRFAIVVEGRAVGGIGFTLHGDVERVSAEIGYWLGEPFWGRGIVTEALRALTAYAVKTHGLTRVYALPFEWNPASFRVLEKAGYVLEGRMRRSAVKDGRVIDQLLYAFVPPAPEVA